MAEYYSRGFKTGSIIRLKMKNFLTYDECEFFTGPRLNIVIGPNGTGKSALTHAICLACCGSTTDVGRSNDLSKFVKHGAEGQESYVEVDIFTESRSIVTIRRMINSDNRGSKWFLNGKVSKQADVKAIVTSLSIDVDNLCSFMPQDKVGDFSLFTPKDLLSQTLKAVHNPNDEFCLSDEQHALSQIQDAKEEYRRKRDAKQVALDASRRELDGMRAELDRMQRRQEKLDLLADYEIRLLAVEIVELEAKCNAKQAVVDEKTEQLRQEKAKVGPLEETQRKLKLQQQARDTTAEATASKQRLIDDSLRGKANTIASREGEIDDASRALLLLARTRATKERDCEAARAKVEELAADEATSRALIPVLNVQLEKCKEELSSINAQKNAVDDKLAELQDRLSEYREVITRAGQELGGLQDSKQIFRTKLQKTGDFMMQQAGVAMDWLEQNKARYQQSGQLRGEVWGPVAMHCEVADPACAAMLEKAIPMNKLMGFVVENDQDRNFLKQELRDRMQLKVDIFTMKRIAIDDRRPFSEQMIQQLGMKGYLCDQIQCPEIIMSLFYVFHNLQKILWGRGADNLSNEQQEQLCRQEGSFKLYIHEVAEQGRGASGRAASQHQQGGMSIIEYKGHRSRNAQAPPSTSSIAISARGVLGNQAGGDDIAERRAALEHQRRDAQAKLNQVNAEIATQNGLGRQCMDQIKEVRARQMEFSAALRRPKDVKDKLDAAKRTLARLEKELAASSDRKKQETDFQDAIRASLASVREAVAVAEKSTAQQVDRLVAASVQDELRDAIRDNADALKEAKRGITDIGRELGAAEKARDDAKRKIDERETELNLKIDRTGKSPEVFADTIYREIVLRCPEDSVADIHARIEALNDEINKIADNPQLQQRFEEVTLTVQTQEAELKQAATELENAEGSLTERSKRWSDTVERIAEKLHVKFSAFMVDLQLGGSVELKKIGKFDDYELQLNVRFRDGQDLCPLDGNKHSGGERAVSTVMFLMALQDMTTSPFRVVDEINQGMDESNERLVFDRVVKSCCGSNNKPQYFLVTPKLLQGLGAMNNDDVTVLLVWNGPGTTKKWTFSQILQRLSGGQYTGASDASMDGFETINHGASGAGNQAGPGRQAKRRAEARAVDDSGDEGEEEAEEEEEVVVRRRSKAVTIKKQKN